MHDVYRWFLLLSNVEISQVYEIKKINIGFDTILFKGPDCRWIKGLWFWPRVFFLVFSYILDVSTWVMDSGNVGSREMIN